MCLSKKKKQKNKQTNKKTPKNFRSMTIALLQKPTIQRVDIVDHRSVYKNSPISPQSGRSSLMGQLAAS